MVFTFWSQVGGQSHLDMMFWPWKFGIPLVTAGLIVAITVQRRVALLWLLLAVTILLAGLLSYYYHVNEPADDQQDQTDQLALYQTRHDFTPRSIASEVLHPNAF